MKSPAAIRVDRAGAKLLSRANPTRVGPVGKPVGAPSRLRLPLAIRPSERISGGPWSEQRTAPSIGRAPADRGHERRRGVGTRSPTSIARRSPAGERHETDDPRRGKADCRQHHQAVGAAARRVRLMTDGSDRGPDKHAPVILGAGMMGDRADVIFADPAEISPFIAVKC